MKLLLASLLLVGICHGEPQCSVPGQCLDSVIIDIFDSPNEKSCLISCQEAEDSQGNVLLF